MKETQYEDMAAQYVNSKASPQEDSPMGSPVGMSGPPHPYPQPPPGMSCAPPQYMHGDFGVDEGPIAVGGAGQVTAFAVAAGLGCFLPWYTIRGIGISVSASGMETEHGPWCLYALIAAVVLTWVEKVAPKGKPVVLAVANLAVAVAALSCFLEWNQESGLLRQVIGLTAWFYLTAAAVVGAGWFAFKRFQESRG